MGFRRNAPGVTQLAIALMLGTATLMVPAGSAAAGIGDSDAPSPYSAPAPAGPTGPVIADLEIKRSPDHSYIGNDIYNTTGVDQTITKRASPGDTKQFRARIRNDGSPGTNTFLGNGSAKGSCFRVRYIPAGFGDLTRIVVRGGMGFLDAPAPPSGNPTVIEVKVRNCALSGSSHDATLDFGPSQGIPFDRVVARINVV
jgi:hypothetical protein